MPITFDPQFYLFLFGVMIVVFTLLIFKMTGASWPGFVVSIVISLILTALAFYHQNPGYGLTVIFYLVIGFGSVGLLVFAMRSWSGFAFGVFLVLMVLALYAYSYYPQYGLYVTLGIIGVVALAIYLVFSAFKYKIKTERELSVGNLGQSRYPELPATNSNQVFGFLEELADKYPDPSVRARYLLSQPDTLKAVYGYLDPQTEREVRRLNG